jgi:hypothetical protein
VAGGGWHQWCAITPYFSQRNKISEINYFINVFVAFMPLHIFICTNVGIFILRIEFA